MADETPTNQGQSAPDESPEGVLEDAAQQVADLSAMASSAAASSTGSAAGAAPFPLPKFGGEISSQDARTLDLLGDVNLNVKIELGRTRMLVEDVLRLSSGSVVELDKLAGDPVDIYVNDRFVARGEVLVLNDNFCVRVNEIVRPMVEADAGAKAG